MTSCSINPGIGGAAGGTEEVDAVCRQSRGGASLTLSNHTPWRQVCPPDGCHSLKIPLYSVCALKQADLVFHSAANPEDVSDPGKSGSGSEQDGMRMKWENLSKDLNTKLQLLFNTMQEEQLSSVHIRNLTFCQPMSLSIYLFIYLFARLFVS